MAWSKLIHTPFGKLCERIYGLDPDRKYHNFHHIQRGYKNAAKLGFEYDANLDAAWLAHDLVFDKHPDKEERSWLLFETIWYAAPAEFHSLVELPAVCDLIGDTNGHENLRGDERIILMDLLDLAGPARTRANHALIQEESTLLYGITDAECATNGSVFLRGLLETAELNRQATQFPDEWNSICRGIETSIELNEKILKVS